MRLLQLSVASTIFPGGIWLWWWQYSHGAWIYRIGQLDPTASFERESFASAGLGWQPDAAGNNYRDSFTSLTRHASIRCWMTWS